MEKFIINQKVSMNESKEVEFKEIPKNRDGLNYINLTIPKYITAFLNSSDVNGGSIFFGIQDDGKIVGVKFNPSQNGDNFQKTINDKIKTNIEPFVNPSLYNFKIHKIYNENNESLLNLYIIQIIVKRDIHNIYFYKTDEKKRTMRVALKTHSQVLELQSLELIDFIKRRKKIIYSQKPIYEISDLFQTLEEVKPLLYWINTPIPKKDSKYYLVALQKFFYLQSTLTSEIDFNLQQGLTNLLKISYMYPKIDGYSYEKFKVATKYFYKYVSMINNLEEYNEWYSKFHYLRGDLNLFLDTHQNNIKYEDKLLIELTIQILDYYKSHQKYFMNSNTLFYELKNIIFKESLNKIPIEINQTVIKLLVPLIEDKLGVKFDNNLNSLKHQCKNDWKQLIEEN